MLFFAEVLASADMAYRQERIKQDFAGAGRPPASRHRRQVHKRLDRRRPVYRPAGARG